MAFILHLENHWFTLRRFGLVSPNPDADSGEGHWFNLNSFLEAPEWVSRLYLGMVLQQAEADGWCHSHASCYETPILLQRLLIEWFSGDRFHCLRSGSNGS